jgi:hypothetical protein
VPDLDDKTGYFEFVHKQGRMEFIQSLKVFDDLWHPNKLQHFNVCLNEQVLGPG